MAYLFDFVNGQVPLPVRTKVIRRTMEEFGRDLRIHEPLLAVSAMARQGAPRHVLVQINDRRGTSLKVTPSWIKVVYELSDGARVVEVGCEGNEVVITVEF